MVGRIDHSTLGPGTDRAIFAASTGSAVSRPCSANVGNDADDAAIGDVDVGPHSPARHEDRTSDDRETRHVVSNDTSSGARADGERPVPFAMLGV